MPLISTIKSRKHPIIGTDFNRAVGFGGLKITSGTHAGLLRNWNRFVPIKPQDTRSILDDHIGNENKLTIVASNQFIGFYIHQSTMQYGDAFFKRLYEMAANPIVSFSEISLSAEDQGTGKGHKLNYSGMELDVAMGCREMSREAGLTMGAYAWAKRGYTLDRSDKKFRLNERLASACMISKLIALEGRVPQNVFTRSKVFSAFSNEDDVCQLADCNFDLMDVLEESDFKYPSEFVIKFTNALSQHINMFKDAYLDVDLVKNKLEAMHNLYVSCKEKGLPLNIGKFLLAGENVQLKVSYDCDVQVQSVVQNMGNLKFSELRDKPRRHAFG